MGQTGGLILLAGAMTFLTSAVEAANEPRPRAAQGQIIEVTPTSPVGPHPHIGPRRGWRTMPVETTGDLSAAYVDAGTVERQGDTRRGWIIMDLYEPIPIPETGGRAQSVAVLAEYRCSTQEWRTVETDLFRGRNAQGLAFRDPSRHTEYRSVHGSETAEAFLKAVCGL